MLGRASVAPTVESQATEVVVDSASPRAATLKYLLAARAADYARAARWLDLSAPESADRGPELAARLRAVLDTRLWLDLERISPRAAGDTADGLPRDLEQLGEITAGEGVSVAIRLSRQGSGREAQWRFSAATVAAIDRLYAELPDYWIREHLPSTLLAVGPYDLLWWQWIALILLVPVAGFIGLLVGRPTRSVLKRIVARTSNSFDDALVLAARGPIVLLWSVVASRLLLGWIALSPPAHAFVVAVQSALAIVAMFWMVLRAINVLQELLPQEAWMDSHPALRSLIPLGARISRLLVFAAGILTVISAFGYPIATILAGLGIGGIAVALGAQKSLEHFFGSISIGVDQPFRVGDWVSVSGIAGSIEAIGLRSTRIRTMDRTLVTIPNGSLAEAQSENFGARERIRLNAMVGLEYGTPVATMRTVRDEIEALLRAHPKTWPERVQVRFSNFGASSLDIELFCWLETTAIDEFREMREELFFGIMEIVERHGASFAFPTQTIHVAGGGAKGPQPL
jgi:MscS family membrane protein